MPMLGEGGVGWSGVGWGVEGVGQVLVAKDLGKDL